MKFYLCKYIPPRADFLATMTAEESKWMKQHGDFLNNLLDKGLIVAHGPVMDPSGGYGVSLYQIADDQDIASITSEDPIVKNGAGHYEHHPMLHLKARGQSRASGPGLDPFAAAPDQLIDRWHSCVSSPDGRTETAASIPAIARKPVPARPVLNANRRMISATY